MYAAIGQSDQRNYAKGTHYYDHSLSESEFWMVGRAWTEPIAVSHGQTY